jgi:hypothetical protein
MSAYMSATAIALVTIIVTSVVSPTNAAPRHKGAIADAVQSSVPIVVVPLPSFEFRGHKIGDVVPADCKVNTLSQKTICTDKTSIVGPSPFNKLIGDVPIQVFDYDYYNGLLYDFIMSFHTNFSTKIRDMLIGKYGQPTNESLGKLQTVSGAEFDDITSEWKFVEGTLTLDSRRADINTGWLVFTNQTVNDQIKADQAAKDGAKGKSAF